MTIVLLPGRGRVGESIEWVRYLLFKYRHDKCLKIPFVPLPGVSRVGESIEWGRYLLFKYRPNKCPKISLKKDPDQSPDPGDPPDNHPAGSKNNNKNS